MKCKHVCLSSNIFLSDSMYRFRVTCESVEQRRVSRINLRVLWALMALRDCGASIHLMAFLCCRVHRSLDSRSNFRSANPAIVSRRNSTFYRPNTTGIFFHFVQTYSHRLQSIEDVRILLL